MLGLSMFLCAFALLLWGNTRRRWRILLGASVGAGCGGPTWLALAVAFGLFALAIFRAVAPARRVDPRRPAW